MRGPTGLVTLAILLGSGLGCGGDGIIARGGNFVLSLDDLRYEISKLGPSASYDDDLEGRLAVVEKLAVRSYLADEAEARGYAGETIDEVVDEEMKLAASETYRKWKVESRIHTPRIQRLPWIDKLDRKLHLKDLRFMVYGIAEDALAELRSGRDFENLAEEVEGREDISMNDLGWVIWKDLDRGVADIVFRLDTKETSRIVTGGDGYHLFYLEGAQRFGLGPEILSMRSKRFVPAMEEERLLENMRAELIDRYHVKFRDDGLAVAFKAFAMSFREERPDDEFMGGVVATYPTGQVLVGDLFSTYYSAPLDLRPYVGDFHGIIEFATDLIMPELEARAAFDLGLGRSRDVVWAGKTAREDHLVPFMEDYFRSQIVVTDQDLADYYGERREDLRKPGRYRARRILVPSAAEAGSALGQLAAGRDFGQVAGEMSMDATSAEKGGDLGWLTAGMVMVYDSVLAGLQPGETSSSFETRGGFEILRLEEREEATCLDFEEAVPRMKMYITNTRANELLVEFVSRKKQEVGYCLNEDLLRSSELPYPEFGARRKELEEAQEKEPEEPTLPRID